MFWVKHPKYNIEVSDMGVVRGPKAERVPRKDRYGYLRINISFEGKIITRTVHRLVSECFDIAGFGETIDHIDGNKENNSVANLQRMTAGDNCSKSFKQRLRGNVCSEICIGGRLYYSKREASRQTGISRRKM